MARKKNHDYGTGIPRFEMEVLTRAQFASTDCPFRMSGADSSIETV